MVNLLDMPHRILWPLLVMLDHSILPRRSAHAKNSTISISRHRNSGYDELDVGITDTTRTEL